MSRPVNALLAAVGLALLSPILAAIAIAIVIESGFPALYRQTRIGLGMRPFTLIKFRTMRHDPAGPQLTMPNDDRVTRVGRFLRSTKLDELPQLWNVLRGEMNLVGPRPEVPKYVEMFPEAFAVVTSVRPGMTGAASLKFPNEERVLATVADPEAYYVSSLLPEKLKIEEEYVASRGPALDVSMLIRTFGALLGSRDT